MSGDTVAQDIKNILYFCDETSHKSDEFMAVGGIAINAPKAQAIENALRDVRSNMNITREIKWSNAKARRDDCHRAHAKLLHELVSNGEAHFHIRFQRMQDWDHKRAGPRRKTDTVSRAFYQLFLHRPIRFYGEACNLHFRPDNGDCTEKLHLYRGQLNTEGQSKYATKRPCVKSIHTRDSKESLCLQLLDVTLGALAALRNNRHEREDTSAAKRELALYIHDLWGNIDLTKNSSIKERKFSIWNARPLK